MKFMLRGTFTIRLEINGLKISFEQKPVVFESLDEKKKGNKINILLVKLRPTKMVRPKDVPCL